MDISAQDDTQEVRVKHTVKDSVFSDLFKDKKNLLKLYKTLHPEDISATEDVLNIVTLNNVLTDNIYNDLGILVRHDKVLLLLEAQSTWTVNILIRMLLYVAHTYQEHFEKTGQKLYGSKKAKMPKPELYVIYTGNRGRKPDVISLSNEFFAGENACIEVQARVIYESDSRDIINQYIIFCKVFNKQVKKYGKTGTAIEETVRICKDKDVLREYLAQKETEVSIMMMKILSAEYQEKLYWEDWAEKRANKKAKKMAQDMARDMATGMARDMATGMARDMATGMARDMATGMAQDMAQNMAQDMAQNMAQDMAREVKEELARSTAEKMIRKGKMSLEEIAECVPTLSFDDIKEIAAGIK